MDNCKDYKSDTIRKPEEKSYQTQVHNKKTKKLRNKTFKLKKAKVFDRQLILRLLREELDEEDEGKRIQQILDFE